jgi:hypothetical protein
MGPSGPQGPQGPQGPSGIIAANQLVMNSPRQPPSNVLEFLAAEVVVNITDATQRIYVHSQAVFSTMSDARVDVRLCAKFQGGFNPQLFGPVLRNISIPANKPTAVSVSGILSGLAAGGYWVGMCGTTQQPAAFTATVDTYTNYLLLR